MLVASAVIAGLAAAAASAGSQWTGANLPGRPLADRVADDERATAAAQRRNPRTVRMRLRSGKVITVWRWCVIAKDVAGKNRVVEAEADRLMPLENAADRAEASLKEFLRAHPERSLPAEVFTRFTALKTTYSLAVSRFNAQVARYNAAAKRHNDVLHACKV